MKKLEIKTLLILFLPVFYACNPGSTQTERPNILFILADDLGYHDLSCMESRYYETPNIDRIAEGSMIFTEGYACCQVCSPSRASIMSGKFPVRHGITDYIGAPSGENWRRRGRFTKLLPANYKHRLDTSYLVLPEALKESGYNTFFAGKWHLGPRGSWPQDHGFDINVGGWDAGSPAGGYFSPFNNPNLENRKDGENLSMRLAMETANFIKDNQPEQTGKPFFAYLAFYAVHSPIETTQTKWKKYRDKADSLGISGNGFMMGKYFPVRQLQDNPVYAGLVEQMDDAVGIVLNTLDSLGLEKNTIVIFTSDNGGVVAGDAYSTSNLPLKAGKGYQFEGGIREPYFIKVPWMDLQGARCDVPVTGTDFYPTLLELAGLELHHEEHQDGVSLVPLLKGGTINERALIWHYPHYSNQGGEPSSIIRRGDWKLIHYYEDERDELYNIVKDPGETRNVIDENVSLAKKLSDELITFLLDAGALYPVPDPEYSAEKDAEHLNWVEEVLMKDLETQRIKFLSKDFDPGNNWWGSHGRK